MNLGLLKNRIKKSKKKWSQLPFKYNIDHNLRINLDESVIQI